MEFPLDRIRFIFFWTLLKRSLAIELVKILLLEENVPVSDPAIGDNLLNDLARRTRDVSSVIQERAEKQPEHRFAKVKYKYIFNSVVF